MLNKDKNIGGGNGRDDTLKIIGIVTMAIDHVGLILYPQVIFVRVIGRLALPIFAWYLTQGYIHTSSLKKYVLRLGIFAVAAQVPYYIATHRTTLNIFFALLLGLLALYAWEKKRYFLVGIIIVISGVIPLDYSFYGILMILAFYIFQEKKMAFLSQAIVSSVGLYLYGVIQPFSLVGVALALYYPKNFTKIQINKYFFYFFYPIHLAIIYGVSLLPYFAK
jgi:hypothetical protein